MKKDKGVQVSATIRPELDAAIDDYRWTIRKTKTELVRDAIEEYAANHQIPVEAPEEVTSDQT